MSYPTLNFLGTLQCKGWNLFAMSLIQGWRISEKKWMKLTSDILMDQQWIEKKSSMKLSASILLVYIQDEIFW